MKLSRTRWSVVSVALLGFAAACGDPAAGTGDGGDGAPPPAMVLTRVGPGAIEANPGQALTLRALLSQAELGPVAGAPITWRVVQDPGGGTQLADTTSDTNEDGVAEMRVTFGGASTGELVIRAEGGEGVTSRAIWKVLVRPDEKQIFIIENGTEVVHTRPDETAAAVHTGVNRVVALRVRVANVKLEPVAQERVRFSWNIEPQHGASFDPAGGIVTTDENGVAEMRLRTGATEEQFEAVATIASGSAATFTITVQGVVTGCRSSRECPGSFICVAGECVSDGTGGGGGCSGNDRPCPLGFVCGPNGSCVPATGGGCELCPDCDPATNPNCVPNGLRCNPITNQCEAIECECDCPDMPGVECPNGFDCNAGICVPNDGSVDVSGHWYTAHNFNIRDALPGWLRTLADGVKIVDQIFLGQLNVPSFVNRLIRGLVQQFIPEWVQDLVYILDAAFEVFSQLRAEGEMTLSAVGGPRVLTGAEAWDSFVFYFLPQCGQNIGGPVNQPRACARVDIYTSELPADLAVDVKGFAARVGGDTTTGYRILMDKREVNMKLGGLIKYVLDQIILVTTGYESLEGPPGRPEEGALYNLIDCPGIGATIDGILDTYGVGEALCAAAMAVVGQQLAKELRNITVSSDVLEFNGSAAARTPGSNVTRSNELGFFDRLDNKNQPADGEWRAKFRAVIGVNDVPGRWYGSRQPIRTP